MASFSRLRSFVGFDLYVDVLRTLFSPPSDDAALRGEVVASVPVSLAVHVDMITHVEGTLSLRRGEDGGHWMGVEVPLPVFGGLALPMRRFAVALDDLLDVVWDASVLGGTLTVTPLDEGVLRRVPRSPEGTVVFRVAWGDRDEAEAFAHAIALADLPD